MDEPESLAGSGPRSRRRTPAAGGGLVPPLCIECGTRPVRRAFGNRPTSLELGDRVVDGVKWRWCCGKTCQGRRRGRQAAASGLTTKALEANRVRIRQQLLQRLVAACKPMMDECGKVDAKAMVEVLYREIRKERALVAGMQYRRRVRATMTDEHAWRSLGSTLG